MKISYITNDDKGFVMNINNHITNESYTNIVSTKSGYILWEDNCRIGFMSYCVLWDKIPFLNFLYVNEEFRQKGYATKAILDWEKEMKEVGYKMTLVSTQVDESSQYLYRKLGYVDCGCIVFSHTPFDQPMEMFLRKVL